MKSNPVKKTSATLHMNNKIHNELPKHTLSPPVNKLTSPAGGGSFTRDRFNSVNINPNLIEEAMKKKSYLNSQTFNQEYKNYPECEISKKPFGAVRAYAMNSYRGISRDYNEDRIVAVPNVPKPPEMKDKLWPKISYFAIFDGHAGHDCANFLQKNLLNYIITNKNFPINPKESLRGAIEKAEVEYKTRAWEKTEDSFQIKDDSGSCAVVALFIENQCFIANVGDSRAVLSLDGGKKIKQITKDHKPNDPQEKKRIETNGGRVYKDESTLVKEEKKKTEPEKEAFYLETGEVKDDNCSSEEEEIIIEEVYRVVPGKLAISRSIGDYSCKSTEAGGIPNVIICTPDIYQIEITTNSDFLLLACDGIFDVFTSEEAVNVAWYAENFCRSLKGDLNMKCAFFVNNVLKAAMHEESTDNVSCIIIALSNFEKITRTKMIKEKVHQSLKSSQGNKK